MEVSENSPATIFACARERPRPRYISPACMSSAPMFHILPCGRVAQRKRRNRPFLSGLAHDALRFVPMQAFRTGQVTKRAKICMQQCVPNACGQPNTPPQVAARPFMVAQARPVQSAKSTSTSISRGRAQPGCLFSLRKRPRNTSIN